MTKPPKEHSKLEILRHSAAHVMAGAIKALFPEARFGAGPAVENGFYYDVSLAKSLSEDDLRNIEEKMTQIIQADHTFDCEVMSRDEARKLFESKNETFKLEILESIDQSEKITIYKTGDFTDLCRGPHVKSTGLIRAFQLTNVAGAYWRGDERNAVMQRVYGTAFYSQKDLDHFIKLREEAKKRDHRRIGAELDLFSFHEEAGPGLVVYHPKGALLRHLIEDYIKKEHLKRGYSFVVGPQILKSDIWKISGHYSYYKENMYIFQTEDEREYAVKPMNCPAQMLIYKTRVRSYRDMPMKFFEWGTVCRHEKSGVLHGLLRTRNFTQDDAHVFCLPEQLKEEIGKIIDFVFDMLKTFGFQEFEIDLSTRPRESIGDDVIWEKATNALKEALDGKDLSYSVCPEGGAFYGPKIDVRIKDALGRPWQCSTIQCDFALPERFGLEYAAQSGKKERPVMVHRAILGSVERFMGCLLEHYAGALPLWLSPVQVAIIPVAKSHEEYGNKILAELTSSGIRAALYESMDTLNRRMRRAQEEKIPQTVVLGDRESQNNTVTVRRFGTRAQQTIAVPEFVAKLKEEVETRGCAH